MEHNSSACGLGCSSFVGLRLYGRFVLSSIIILVGGLVALIISD
jgi:hypothetical protein